MFASGPIRKQEAASRGRRRCRTIGSDPVSCIASAKPLDQILLIALRLTVRHFGIDDAAHLGSEIGCDRGTRWIVNPIYNFFGIGFEIEQLGSESHILV
jgi:hypothetical protein